MRTLVCNVETGARPLACGAAEQLLRSRAGPSNRRTAQLSDNAEGLQVNSPDHRVLAYSGACKGVCTCGTCKISGQCGCF